MALPVVYRQAARSDIVDAARGYETERAGLASAFVAEVERIEKLISESPRLHQVVHNGVRRAMLRRFPFGLFYLDEGTQVLVLACIDLRRDPQLVGDILGRR